MQGMSATGSKAAQAGVSEGVPDWKRYQAGAAPAGDDDRCSAAPSMPARSRNK